MKLDVRACALACGLVWGLGLFLLTWYLIFIDGPSADITFLGRIYRGYTITPLGSVIGLIWAVADGFVAGAVLAWVYNKFASGKPAAP